MQTGRWIADLGRAAAGARDAARRDTAPARSTLVRRAAPVRYRPALLRFRYGPGVCKVDWALPAPVPWTRRGVPRAATVHLGGSFEEIARGEADVAAGRHPERPFCIVVQPCVRRSRRALRRGSRRSGPTATSRGSTVDMTDRIEAQIERFAPGFRDLVLARSTITAAQIERHNPNYVGWRHQRRRGHSAPDDLPPDALDAPYATPLPGLYLCSASTPPGRRGARDVRGRRRPGGAGRFGPGGARRGAVYLTLGPPDRRADRARQVSSAATDSGPAARAPRASQRRPPPARRSRSLRTRRTSPRRH